MSIKEDFILYKDIYECGLINKEDYYDLLQTLNLEKLIVESSDNLEFKDEIKKNLTIFCSSE